MSTATAPVSRKAAALSTIASIAVSLASRAPPATGRCLAMAARNCSRQSIDVENRAPAREMTSLGKTTVPAPKAGSSPPARPKLIRLEAPASTSVRAAIAARARPMPLTANKAPSLKKANPSFRLTRGPRVRASASSAATTPRSLPEDATSMSDSAARQGAVGRQGPEREISGVAVIPQIEHARKARRRELTIAPQSIRLLRAHQEFDAAARGVGSGLAGGEQPQKRPSALKRGARKSRGFAGRPYAGRRYAGRRYAGRPYAGRPYAGRAVIGIVALAPAAVRILPAFQPLRGAPHGGIVGADVRLRECRQHRPGAVYVIGAPAAEPRPVGLLLAAQVGNGAIQGGFVLWAADARQHRHDPRGDIARGRIEERAVIGERDLVEVVAGVVGVERGEAAVLALHSDQPIERAANALGIARRISRLMHGPHDHGRVVEIRVVAVRELKSPTAPGQAAALHLPVSGLIEELPGLQPVERSNRRVGRGGVAGLLHRQSRERGVPDRRDTRLTVRARRTYHGQLLQGSFCGDAPRVVRRITQDHHRFQGIDHRRKDGAEAVFAVQPLEHPGFRAPGRGLAHARRNQGIDHAPEPIGRQKRLGQNP